MGILGADGKVEKPEPDPPPVAEEEPDEEPESETNGDMRKFNEAYRAHLKEMKEWHLEPKS
jgi:hypothetical protein